MKSDIEEMFRDTKPSLIKIVSQETERYYGAEKKQKIVNKASYLAAGSAILVLALASAGLYFFFFKTEPVQQPPKLITPATFFATETSRTISIKTSDRGQFLKLLKDSLEEPERKGTFKRVLIKLQDESGEYFASFADFWNLWKIKPPQNLLSQTEGPLTIFVMSGEDRGKLGLAAKIKDQERVLKEMFSWEETLLLDLSPLLFGEKPESILAPFEDRTYRNIDWRYLKLSQTKDLGLGYAVFPARNLLIITTGREIMETMINRLFEAR